MGPKMRASAILDGRTCHSRIEQAYAQPRLFEDAQRMVDMFGFHESIKPKDSEQDGLL